MVSTPQDRRAAAHILTPIFGPGVTPGLDTPVFRQVAGYGYPGVPTLEATPPTGEDDLFRFIYRPIRRKLRARKRRFN